MGPSRHRTSERIWCAVACVIFVVTVAQLAAGAFLNLDQFAGKAFGARLIMYPIAMLLLPAVWWITGRVRNVAVRIPWAATSLIMWSFFVDVTGNTLNLYDTVHDWDDANHFFNWLTLSLGIGLCMARAHVRPRWILAIATIGTGAALAIGWEIAEWYTFIRHGTELAGAYEDTLSDETLGTLGSVVAALILLRITRGDARCTQGDADVELVVDAVG